MSDGGNPVPNKFCSAREPGDEQLGAMHKKIAIFKEGNSVCSGTNIFSGALILYSERKEQLGAMRQKMAIFEEGNSVCRVHFFQALSF